MVACLRCGEDNPHQARFCMHCATELPGSTASSHRVRKTVTVLFSDIVDSTRLGDQRDIELSNLVLSRFYDEARHVLEQYEGTVEKFIGDAVVGIFGVPSLHEDDALRAVRAAIELRTALVGLNGELERDHDVHVRIRTAVNTGAVVVTEGAAGRSQPTVLGDAIDVASRLQHEAEPDEILIGEATYRLVRDHVTAEPVQPLRLRGKGQPVTAWRLRSLEPPIRHRPRRFAAPMVGRDHDLDAVLAFFERATSQRSCHLVMVLGEAGVGKTRLVEELERRIEQRAAVRRGSCRPYGEGITFEPVAEIIRRAAGGEGNPLFTEEWIADLTEAGTLRLVDDRWLVTGDPAAVRATPPRIDAIVTTRLDRLMPEERAVVERAAVIGMPFRVAEVAALLTSAAKPVAATLMDLARKELLANEDATFRFRHTLIRDAAYQAIPKEHRALLHSSYANWLENTGGNYASHSAELIGRHLEAAHRYQTELGRHDDGTRALARRAGRHLAAAGHRGLRGRDVPASVAELLSSAVRLLAGNDAVRREALLDLADALRQSGARQRAIDVYNQALEVARAAADEVRATRAELGRLEVGYEREPERTLTEAPAVTSRGLEVFERAGDDLNLANTWRFRAFIDAAVGRSSAAREAAERAMALARRAGDERFEARVMRLYCFILDWGPTPVREVAERTRQALEWAQAQATREVEKDSLNILARAAAMGGDLEGPATCSAGSGR
jgi:class 3 adenylate cyclase/tetratricopeptide (TPR) repeat protein